MAAMRFLIYRFFQGGSRSSQVINSLGTKLDIIFIIVSLKTESEDSQPHGWITFFKWSEFATQFFHKEEGKKHSNRIQHKVFDGDNQNVTKDELQNPLSY